MLRPKVSQLLALAVLGAALAAPAAAAAEKAPEPEKMDWSFDGPLGTFDRAQIQRGYQVYKEVCAACHSMNLISYRNFSEPGGPEFSEAQVKALAAEVQVASTDESGETVERAGLSNDRLPSPYANDKAAAAANGGKAPPDLSVIAKAREGGPDYIHALLTGYTEAPEGFEVPPGGNYNTYFPGHVIAMPVPLSDGQVTYSDGTANTADQMSQDVAAFLMWTAEPKLEERNRLGMQVVLFLLVFGALTYFTKRRIWSSQH